MKQTFLTFSLLCVLFPLSVAAQNNYKNARIVPISSDTTQGYVQLQEWNKNPSSIEFKSSLNTDKTQTLTAVNTQYIEIEGIDSYQRYTGPISTNYLDASRLTTNPDLSTKPDTVFLKQLYRGDKLAFFSYKDYVKVRYFVQNLITGTTQELYYTKYLDAAHESRVITLRQYQGQLWGLAQSLGYDSNALEQKIVQSDYQESELLKIVQIIEGHESLSSKKNKGSKTQTYPFISAALYRSNAEKRDGELQGFEKENSVSYSPMASVGLVTYFNKFTKKLAVRWEVSYNKTDHTFKSQKGEVGYSSYYVQIVEQSYHRFAFLPQMQYNIAQTERWQFFVSGGLSLNYGVIEAGTSTTDLYYFKKDEKLEIMPYNTYKLEHNNVWIGIPLRLGASLANKYGFSLGYNMYPKPGIMHEIKSSSLQVGLDYYFSK